MKDNKYVERIIIYCKKIQNYLQGVSNFEAFAANEEKIDAVLLNMQQIGETAKKLSDAFKNNFNDVNWMKIIGLRNFITHEYEGINFDIIYFTAKNDIPILLNTMSSVFK